MDEAQKAELLAASIASIAANKAVVRLHALLAAQGAIDAGAIETLRHLHLRDFDVSTSAVLHQGGRQAIEDIRLLVDDLWQAAIQVDLPSAARKPG